MTFPLAFVDLAAAAVLPPRSLHLAVGMFDGVHLGHRAVIEAAVHSARRMCGLAGVLTFWPHPSVLFRPEEPTRLITPPAIKARLLGQLGVDAIITQPFTPAFAQIAAEDFLPELRRHLTGLQAVYVGENWRFGRGRRGDVDLLVAEGRRLNISVFSAFRVSHDGEPISSTRIRALLTEGAIEQANTLLGYTYFSVGVVVPGDQLGRKLGFPTLNLPWEPELAPRYGVYAVRVLTSRAGQALPAVANYGIRPTVASGQTPRLEVHVLGECPVGAGDEVTVEWMRFLRPEQTFAGLEALQAQIRRDCAQAAAFFSA